MDNWFMYQNYFFQIDLVLKTNKGMPYEFNEYSIPAGFEYHIPKKIFYLNDNITGKEIKNYVKNEIEEMNIFFMFNNFRVPFYIDVNIYRSIEHRALLQHEINMRNPRNNEDRLNSSYKTKILNAEKTFKESECVICLTEPSNVLFCNCGHICICIECSKKGESLEKCPICKTENTILRFIE